MSIQAASAAQLVAARAALAAVDLDLQKVLQNGDTAAYLNTDQRTASNALLATAKAALDAVVAAT